MFLTLFVKFLSNVDLIKCNAFEEKTHSNAFEEKISVQRYSTAFFYLVVLALLLLVSLPPAWPFLFHNWLLAPLLTTAELNNLIIQLNLNVYNR